MSGEIVYVILMIIDFFLLLMAFKNHVEPKPEENKEEEEKKEENKEENANEEEDDGIVVTRDIDLPVEEEAAEKKDGEGTEGANPEDKQAAAANSEEVEKLKHELDEAKSANEKLQEQIDELNRKMAMMNQYLSEEQKNRIEAEEKAEAECLERERLAASKDREISELEQRAEAEKKALAEKYEAEKAAWTSQVKETSQTITDLSFGKIRTINHLDLDQLISVHGKSRPIAVYVPCKSSELTHSGAFIYDTHKLPDNSLYLFVGKDCPPALEAQGEKLLQAYSDEYQTVSIVHVKRTLEGPEFNKMIKTIGGHIDQIQSTEKAGDELFFENNFFKVKFHVVCFVEGKTLTPAVSKSITVDVLPEKGAAIIDCSDKSLYLYMSSVMPTDPVEKGDQENAIKFMTSQPEYSNRDVTIFNHNCIPANLKILLGLVN
ncbi:hypothetical protein TVAG_088470 [Trichomonas vaginalis G3]|uniref:Uncharacterized protein n=1 Tax=Trichomonas vaginalis (strain ATCC PRA-98 / G3) TaxID=412133 RepID=A2EAZ2_TRIV3|nr:biological adhesion protein [Trichomonas vaginalis G3]EAY10132.1 hypothetical protein TVAG_088470 [Trichomonas vaginalis G3]KAI5534492.1 biological adhesion protein [Trichomonas vaginalis G3]|eukprot:XP_001322355.1 hypothetical protein [Trichomonas vaginalis G3]